MVEDTGAVAQGNCNDNNDVETLVAARVIRVHQLEPLYLFFCQKGVPYPHQRGPIGGAPYTGPRLGDGPIFEVSVPHLDAKERQGKLSILSL